MAPEKITELSETNFAEHVNVNDKAVVVDFWAPWCGPCRALGPIVEELATEMETRVQFYKVNIEDDKNLALKFHIRSIPSLLIFQNGAVVGQCVGFSDKESLKEKIESCLTH
jgi:thioredoxin 1